MFTPSDSNGDGGGSPAPRNVGRLTLVDIGCGGAGLELKYGYTLNNESVLMGSLWTAHPAIAVTALEEMLKTIKEKFKIGSLAAPPPGFDPKKS